ncbi:MAG: hypothetical protein ACLSUZ_05025 [Bifidobacterium pseudocatenulatum]
MVHLAVLLMPSGPKDVTTERSCRRSHGSNGNPRRAKRTGTPYRRSSDGCIKRQTVGRSESGRAKGEEAARASQTMPDRYIAAAIEKATSSEKLTIRLGAECGLRRGEIARVHSDDVVADSAGRSSIVRGKGDKQRIVPLPDDLACIIMDARGYLFPGRFGGHVEESYVGDHISHLLPDGYAATRCATGSPPRHTPPHTTCSWSRNF